MSTEKGWKKSVRQLAKNYGPVVAILVAFTGAIAYGVRLDARISTLQATLQATSATKQELALLEDKLDNKFVGVLETLSLMNEGRSKEIIHDKIWQVRKTGAGLLVNVLEYKDGELKYQLADIRKESPDGIRFLSFESTMSEQEFVQKAEEAFKAIVPHESLDGKLREIYQTGVSINHLRPLVTRSQR